MDTDELLIEVINLYPDPLNEAIIAVLEECCEDAVKQFPDSEADILLNHVFKTFEIRWNLFIATFNNERLQADNVNVNYRGRLFTFAKGQIIFRGKT